MKRWYLGLSAFALIATAPLVGDVPVLAQLQKAGENIDQAVLRPQIKLDLTVAKQIVKVDEQGRENISWEPLENEAVVMPGDMLRYTVSGDNLGEAAAKNLVVTQPIPAQTTYELGSAVNNGAAQITYSIDNGNSFVEAPTVEVTLPDGTVEEQPAPAETYTHIRWQFAEGIDSTNDVEAVYKVQVR